MNNNRKVFFCLKSNDNIINYPEILRLKKWDSSKYIFNPRGHGHLIKPFSNLKTFHNNTYYETPDNMMRVPIAEFNDELQTKKRASKKSPKRTIQKIIKKHRKAKKLFFNQVTSKPTQPAAHEDLVEDAFVPDEVQREGGVTTTQVNQRKRIRNRNSKVPRNPTPFQRLQPRHDNEMGYRRMKRETDRDNTLIVEDFDEMEFLGHKKDYNVVKMHSKKYW